MMVSCCLPQEVVSAENCDSSPRHDLPLQMPVEGALSHSQRCSVIQRANRIKQDKSSRMTAVQVAFQIISTLARQRPLVHKVSKFSRSPQEPKWVGYQSQARGPEADCSANCLPKAFFPPTSPAFLQHWGISLVINNPEEEKNSSFTK